MPPHYHRSLRSKSLDYDPSRLDLAADAFDCLSRGGRATAVSCKRLFAPCASYCKNKRYVGMFRHYYYVAQMVRVEAVNVV